MVELVRGVDCAVARSDSTELVQGKSVEFEAGDGEAKARGGNFAMSRGLYIPCSARNLARISKARWRAASFSWAVGRGPGDGGAELGGLGA
jgi:hypothetical protein